MEKRIGIIATRLGGLDGVSLEVDKWAKVLKKMGWKIYLCTGELMYSPHGYSQISGKSYPELIKATIIPGLSIGGGVGSGRIETEITRWFKKYRIKKIIVENINSLPINIPAAVAIDNVLEKNPNITAIFHHHDFYWERSSYLKNKTIRPFLKKYFPPKRTNAIHITINSSAQGSLLKKHGIKSVVIPNIFECLTLKKDKYNVTFKKDIGLKKDDLIFLVPVRIVPRKNIEAAIELIRRSGNPKIKLVIAGCIDFGSSDYLKKLKKLSSDIENRVKFICQHVGPRRGIAGLRKIYTIFDAYTYTDFVIYSSLYEGWGNALGEAMALRIPVLVNRYKIFKEDIEKLGFEGVKINNGRINTETVKQVMEILTVKSLREKITKKNYLIVKKHLDLKVLEKHLKKLL